MSQMNISNTLFNDTSTGELAYVEQLTDRLLKNYISTLSSTDKSRIAAKGTELGFTINDTTNEFQDKLNKFFLNHWVEYQRFLLDEGLDPDTIDSWKEIQDFLEGLPDDETMWLKNQLQRLDNRITAMDIPDGGAYDVSADHVDGGGNYATYADLSTALAAISTDDRKSGMSIRFINSTTNKYEQWRYMLEYANTTAGNAAFTTVTNWQGIDAEPTVGSNNLVKSGGVQNELALGAVYDVSAKNPTAGPNNDGKWASLSTLLSDANLSTIIPVSYRKGGMSIKFVQSSDNNYVQFRYMPSDAATVATFTNVDNWQGVDAEPTLGSKNLVDSGGVKIVLDKKQNLLTKNKSQFVKLADAYVYWSYGGGYYLSDNYELYVVRADGIKSIYYKAYDNGVVEVLVGFWSGNTLEPSNLLTDISIKSGIGIKEGTITDIPSNARFITYCNRKADGEGDFVITYKDSIPTAPINALYIDSLVNSDSSNGDLKDNSSYNYRRVITKSVCAFPQQGMAFKVRLPIGLQCSFWYSGSLTSARIDSTTTWLYDGDTQIMPTTATNYRIVFRNNGNLLLESQKINELINSGDIAFYVDHADVDVIQRNLSKEVRVEAAKRNLTDLLDGMDSMFCIAHISDLHGDSERFRNFAKYCNHIGVDATFNSGDSVMYGAKDFNSYAVNIMQQYPSIPYLFCIGNHEVFGLSSVAWSQGLFGDNISPLVSYYGYLKASETPADDCYYYLDFPKKKIRAIVINYYNGGNSSGAIGQTQIDWFISTLASTPSGYGVLIMNHSPEDKVVASAPYDVFRQKVRVTTYQENGFYVGNRPIMHIVDAFIGRDVYSDSYTEQGETITIDADFTGITDDTIEFIAYIVGHRHEDWIGYYDNSTHKQLSLGVTAGCALFGHGSNAAFANQEDLPRGGVGTCQDAFNVYTIDRVHKTVKVVRIGADLTFDFIPREYMEIPYSD